MISVRLSHRIAACATAIVFCVQLCSCAAVQQMPRIHAVYYPQCAEPFRELEQAQKDLIRRTVVAAVLGASGGALIGALTTKNAKGALVGGLLGGLVGGAAGYVTGKQNQIRDVRERLKSYRLDMRTDISNMSRVEMYAMMSLQCYIREFRSLLGDFKARRITRDEFSKRYAEIRNALQQIGGLLDEAHAQSVRRDREYREALASERALAGKRPKGNRSLAAAEKRNASRTGAVARADSLDKMERLATARQQEAARKVAKHDAALNRAVNGTLSADLDALSNDFDAEYTTGTVHLDSTGDMYAKTMNIMNDAATRAGIDMV